MTATASQHDWTKCKYCYHELGDAEGGGCRCPDCMYAPGVQPPDHYGDVYRAHVRMTGMAPPHDDGTQCHCLFPTSGMHVGINPGSPAEHAYDTAYAEYLSLMRPVWQEVGAPEGPDELRSQADDEDLDFFRAVVQFDARMGALTRPPLLIAELAVAAAYLDARYDVTHPDCEQDCE